jgi:guanylate kinase
MQMIEDGDFLEYAEVFGYYYGTLKQSVEELLAHGEDVIFDIDWQGHRSLVAMNRGDVVSVFLLPPSKHELRERLVKRAQDASETIELRMQKADSELHHWQEYDYVVINKDLRNSFRKMRYILRAERLKRHRRLGLYDFVSDLMSQSDVKKVDAMGL